VWATGYRRCVLVCVALLASQALNATPAAGHSNDQPNVAVVNLHVDGRYDTPLGIDNAAPTLGWEIVETRGAAAHPCYRRHSQAACPGDRQTAYQIQAATSEHELRRGRLIWDSGKVASDRQTGIPYTGKAVASRQRVAWQVRVWDADRRVSDWSKPGGWEMGLLGQSDWGSARWIEYPGRTENQPMPMFARQFTIDHRRQVAGARL
jgi:alpha-L-rhamnosidase